MKYETRITRLTIAPEKEPLFSTAATHVLIDDEAAGEFVKIQQQCDSATDAEQVIRIDPEEWPSIRSAIDQMMMECRKENA